MATLAERFAAFKAERAAAAGPEAPEGVPSAVPVAQPVVMTTPPPAGGGIASAFGRFRSAKVQPDVAESWMHANEGSFQRSLDGDTIDISRGKTKFTVRMDGIDAPESGQALGPVAHQKLDELIGSGRKIRVGSRRKDKYGRDVSTVYVERDGKWVNVATELVRDGYVKMAYEKGLSAKLRKELEEAQTTAQKGGKGIWSDPTGGEDPAAWRRSQGRQNMAQGHDNRPTIDQGLRSVKDFHRGFMAAKSGGRGQGVDSAVGAGGPAAPKPMYFDKLAPDAEAVRLERAGIPRSEQYQKETTWFDKVTGALDYLGNVSRSAIKGVVEGGKGTQYALEAAKKERRTSATSLRDTATERAGLGKLRVGVDDGKFSVGDVGDFALDLTTDIVTDPLTFVTSGFTGLVKGTGAAAKLAPGLSRGAAEAKIGLRTPEALRYMAVKQGAAGGIGAALGAGAVGDDASMTERLAAAGVGALVGVKGPAAMGKAGSVFRGKADDVSNWYAVKTRGSRFANFTEARKVALNAFDKLKNSAESIKQGRFEALDGLDAAQKVRVSSVLEGAKTETLRRRQVAETKITARQGSPEYGRQFNDMMRKINDEVENEWLPQVLAKEEQLVAGAVASFAKHNEDVMKKLNRQLHGFDVAGKDGKGVVGIRYHTDDVYPMKDLEKKVNETEELLGQFQVFKAEKLERSTTAFDLAQQKMQKQFGRGFDEKTATKVEGEAWVKTLAEAKDETYGMYADRLSKAFLDDVERDAVKLMRDYGETAAKQKPVRALETVLKSYDKVTNVIKAQMLYFSSSWLKNNMFDNVAKGFIENGWHGLVDVATMGKFQKGVYDDVRDLYAGKLNRKYGSADFKDALEHGALDNPMFKSIHDESTRRFFYRPEDLAVKLGKETIGKRVADAISRNPINEKVAALGSHMEGTARMLTFMRAKEALLKSPRFKNATAEELKLINEMAADLVKKTFFDYGDVTHFEKAVFARMIPFYSFYSKNLPYWIKAAIDPEKVGRVVAMEKARRNIGEDPSAFDKEGMTPYLENAGPRKLGRTESGDTRYGIVPGGSMYDALRMLNPKDLKDQFIEKANPVPKAIYELISGNDLFDGQKLYPSASEKHKKFLFSRGHKYAALGIPGVELDAKGNPYATSDAVVFFDKVFSTALPHGLVDQVAGSVGKVSHGKETAAEAVINRLSPVQMVKVSQAYARMVRKKKEESRNGKEDR